MLAAVKEAGWGSTAQSGRRLGSNRAAGGDARSEWRRCAVSLVGLRPRTRDSAGIWSAAGAVLLSMRDGWAPIELLEGMQGATGRDVWRR